MVAILVLAVACSPVPKPAQDARAKSASLGDVWLQTQAELDTFCALYDAVDGTLIMDMSGDVSVDCLSAVSGELLIRNGDSLSFPRLASVGSMSVKWEWGLERVELPELEVVFGNLSISSEMLEHLELPKLRSVGGEVSILRAKNMEALAFPSLEAVGGSFFVATKMASLRSLEVPVLRRVGGEVYWDPDSGEWAELEAPALETVGGRLRIDSSLRVEEIALGALVSVGGDIEISAGSGSTVNLGALTSAHHLRVGSLGPDIVVGLGSLESVGDLTISGGAPDLASLRAAGTIDIDAGTAVHLPSLFAADGIDLGGVYLQELSAPLLATVTGPLRLGPTGIYETSLVEVTFPALESAGALQVADHESVARVEAPLLTALGGDLAIEGARRLALVSLPGLMSVEGDLRIQDSPSLTEVGSLSSLQRIGGDLSFERNEAMTDISGLSSVESVGGDFSFRDNAALATSDVVDLFWSIGEENIGGTYTISGNAP